MSRQKIFRKKFLDIFLFRFFDFHVFCWIFGEFFLFFIPFLFKRMKLPFNSFILRRETNPIDFETTGHLPRHVVLAGVWTDGIRSHGRGVRSGVTRRFGLRGIRDSWRQRHVTQYLRLPRRRPPHLLPPRQSRQVDRHAASSLGHVDELRLHVRFIQDAQPSLHKNPSSKRPRSLSIAVPKSTS